MSAVPGKSQTPKNVSDDLHIKDFSLSYMGKEVFKGFNLSLAAGKWNVLLGRSGVGKSSLLKAIAGLLSPESYRGQISTGTGSNLAGTLSWMTQDDLLLPWLSVLDNVLIGNKLRGPKQAPQRIAKDAAITLLVSLGLENSFHLRPHALSGGMRQRTALARTLLEDRPIILLDEPFSALDAITRTEMQELTHLHLKNKTVVMITHDPLEALRLAHHIFVLKGPVVTKSEVLTPRSPPMRDIKSPELLEDYEMLMGQLSSKDVDL